LLLSTWAGHYDLRPAINEVLVPNIASLLKAEIARVARKELRSETDTLKKAVATYRRDIAALKRRVAGLESQLKRVSKGAVAKQTPESPEEDQSQLRFSPTRFAAQRKKLGLSAASFAKLLGVSSLSVYKWESGKTRPRRAQLEAIAATRGLGKREIQARLEVLDAASD
jgi:DNA-binding transcriptional regulator YiaG